MPIRDYGAVCDVSTLVDRKSIERARKLFDGCGLYIPSSTYSWLARTQLIEVRNQIVSYSLINQMIRSGNIYPIYLPEIYDEIARKLMFRVDHKVPLTDLRSLLLSAHLQVPLLTFDDRLLSRLAEHIGIWTLGNIRGHGDRLVARNVLGLYREILLGSNEHFYKLIENGGTFPQIAEDILKAQKENFKGTKEAVRKVSRKQSNPGALNFRYLAWDILPVIREYLDQHLLGPRDIRGLCERVLLLVASSGGS